MNKILFPMRVITVAINPDWFSDNRSYTGAVKRELRKKPGWFHILDPQSPFKPEVVISIVTLDKGSDRSSVTLDIRGEDEQKESLVSLALQALKDLWSTPRVDCPPPVIKTVFVEDETWWFPRNLSGIDI